MSAEPFEAIPESHRATARAALSAAFGGKALADVRAVAGGASGALTFRVEVSERPYLLRMEARRGPMRNPHQYLCMQGAAEAGLAPPLHYLDAEAGVAVMDFLPSQPLETFPGGPDALARAAGELIGRLHALPAFPALANYFDTIERLFGFIRGSGLFCPGLLDPHAEGFARIRAAYPWNETAHVASHNDPNPRNIIFDGARLWLIDWETAYRNDPLTDVAILAENFAPTGELEDVLLRAWAGRAPDALLRARLAVMRVVTRLYYACLLLMGLAAVPRDAADADLAAPSPAEFTAAVTAGRLNPTSAEAMRLLGKICLAGFLAGVNAPGFARDLTMARGG